MSRCDSLNRKPTLFTHTAESYIQSPYGMLLALFSMQFCVGSASILPGNNKTSILPDCMIEVLSCDLELSPYHLIDYSHIALDDLHDLRRNIFLNIVRHRDAVVTVLVHGDGGIDCL